MVQAGAARSFRIQHDTQRHHHRSNAAMQQRVGGRVDVRGLGQCQQLALRYTEFGGYYVDPRARRLNAELITD